MRSAAQIVSYEIAMGFALVGVLMLSGSLNLVEIVNQQGQGLAGGSVFSWNWLPLFPMFLVYLISGVAETNRARLTWPKANRKSWPASTWNTRAWRSQCSSWPNTPT